MFSKLLVPTDFTDEADKVLAYAKGLKPFGAKEITLIHVVDVGRAVVWPLPMSLTGAIEGKLEERRSQLEGEGFVARTLLLEGKPSDEVLKTASSGQYSMIITGSHGKRLIEEILLGSVSQAISRDAKIPVLLIGYDTLHDLEKEGSLEQYASSTFKKVLFLSDFSDASNDALGAFKELKKAGAKKVAALHIVDVRHMETEQEKLEKLDACSADMGRLTSHLQNEGFEVESICRAGDPLAEILSVIDEVGASLIVMGSHSNSVLKEWLVGSVSLNVIRTADRPALIIHKP